MSSKQLTSFNTFTTSVLFDMLQKLCTRVKSGNLFTNCGAIPQVFSALNALCVVAALLNAIFHIRSAGVVADHVATCVLITTRSIFNRSRSYECEQPTRRSTAAIQHTDIQCNPLHIRFF